MRKGRAEEKEGPEALAQCAPGTSKDVTGWNLQNDPARELSSPPGHRRGDRPPLTWQRVTMIQTRNGISRGLNVHVLATKSQDRGQPRGMTGNEGKLGGVRQDRGETK